MSLDNRPMPKLDSDLPNKPSHPQSQTHAIRRGDGWSGLRARQLFMPDPCYGGHGGFEYVLDLEEETCDRLLRPVKRELAQGGALGASS